MSFIEEESGQCITVSTTVNDLCYLDSTHLYSGSSSSRILVDCSSWRNLAEKANVVNYAPATQAGLKAITDTHHFCPPLFILDSSASISLRGKALVTMIFSGQGCCNFLSIIKIGHGSTKWCSNESPKCQTYSFLLSLGNCLFSMIRVNYHC